MDSRLRQVRIETVLRRLIAGDETVESAALRIMRDSGVRVLVNATTPKGYHNWIFKYAVDKHGELRVWVCSICDLHVTEKCASLDGVSPPPWEGCKGKQNAKTEDNSDVLPMREDGGGETGSTT